MTRLQLPGLDGSNPLGFMAAVGLLRVLSRETPSTRLGFLDDGSCQAFLEGHPSDVVDTVVRDAEQAAFNPLWLLSYEKREKKGTKTVADLKAPPPEFEQFLRDRIDHWRRGDREGAAYAAAYGTSLARDGKENTKPTAFHFTSANQEFLKAVEESRRCIETEWVRQSLLEGHASRPGSNLRWDPAADRNWALMANNPNEDGTSVDAPLEWLAFRGLPLFPCFPENAGIRARVVTTAITKQRDETNFQWPLWSVAASLHTAASLIRLDWSRLRAGARAQGVFAVCHSELRRTSKGFGNFSPAVVES
jgi:hypothetical protein